MDSKIPNIRFKGFTDAWEQRRLGEVTIYQNGKGYEDSQSSSGKFELINLNSISIDGGLKSSGKYIESADKTLLTDDLVMVLSDVGKGDLLGRVAIIPKDNYYVLNQRVALIRPKNKQQTNYLFSYINSHQRYFKLHGAGMSQLNISKGSVENFPLLLPSLPEQQQIGTFFAHLDTLISLHQRKCDQTKELKKTMLQKMFPKKGETVPEIRFPEFTDAWEQRKLGDEVRIVMGQSPNSENYTDDPNDYILVQGNADMKNGRVLPRVWTTQVTKQAEKDDLILSVRAPVGDIGKTAYDVVIGRGVAAIKGNEFIFQNLGKMKSDGYWTRYSTGSTFESINSTDIKEAIISVPAIEEQDKIGSFFKQLDKTITLHQRKLDLLKEQKKGYLQKMFPKNGAKVPELRF
ncbi:restriction endonuclease subunit S, partial [Streptococcus alactolyticus]|uniref:restriction endonuclease subunit S n=1 Tax=Streptococcus alactolyticus TaxID=29389 RepID=UPI003BB4C192